MAKPQQEVYFVFMNFDPVYERLRADRSVHIIEPHKSTHIIADFTHIYILLPLIE
jgi:hypothetical protein